MTAPAGMNRPRQTHNRRPRSRTYYMQLFRAWENQMLRDCLVRHCGNQCAVARELGLHRNTIHRMLRVHRLTGESNGR